MYVLDNFKAVKKDEFESLKIIDTQMKNLFGTEDINIYLAHKNQDSEKNI